MISLVRPAWDLICLKWPWNWNEFDTPAVEGLNSSLALEAGDLWPKKSEAN